MPIASFRGKAFQVSANKKYTFSGLSWSGALDTETQDKLGSKPSTYIKGESLDGMSFEVPLRADFGINVRAQIEDWKAILASKKPDIFILGSKPLGKNKWLLKSVSVSDEEIDASGNFLKATLKLEFEEYVRAGTAQSQTSAAGATNLNLTPSQYIYDPPNKADDKRDNPNLDHALWGL
ncbi:phage tail protein [Ferviditalea candida]|uniref:Phage tail protein n=1 Tax=Ferviditalea candida TaxID=3108399 RepID=A0ABU5ZKQ2_9BACL|nr:phage tail protein [Paenibacillaceae bacterium T2]